MNLILKLLVLSLVIEEVTISAATSGTVLLTESLIESLRADPYLLADPDFSPNSKRYVDKRIENYKNRVKKTRINESSRNRRSVNGNVSNKKDVVELTKYNEIPVENCLDLRLFKQKGSWYAASVEKYGTMLKLYKHEGNKFLIMDVKPVVNATKLSSLQINSSTIIVVAENGEPTRQFVDQSSIYQLRSDILETKQKFNESFSEETTIWKTDHDVFMTFVKNSDRTKINSVYKWMGNHFDVYQNLEATEISKVSAFSFDHSHFLALAGSKRIDSDRIFSEILKYDEELKLYRPFQRIFTYACSDIQHFEVQFGTEEGHYIFAANLYKNDTSGNKSYNTTSVIYKFIEDYFLPFQTVRMNGIKQIEPIMVNGDIVLLVLTLDGVKALHYNGWNFRQKNVVTSPREKPTDIMAIRHYHFQGKNIILVLGRNATSINLYEMSYVFQNEIRTEHDEMLSWCQNSLEKFTVMHDDSVLGKQRRGDIGVHEDSESLKSNSELDDVISQLKKYEWKLDEINENLDALLLHKNHHRVVLNNITANEIVLENKGSVVCPNINFIDGVNISTLIANTINVNEGFEISNMNFDTVRIEEYFHPQKINHNDGILHRNKKILLHSLNINGNALFRNKVILSNSSKATEDKETANKKKRSDKFKTIKANSIRLGGFINDLDVPTLNKYAFRKSGGFGSARTCTFDHLTAENLETLTCSGKRPEDIMLIVGRDYESNRNSILHKDIDVNRLQISRHLNNISVDHDGKLDILMKNRSESQYISGLKTFQNLEIQDVINLQGKIGKQFESFDPLVLVYSDVDVEEDVVVIGNVTVENLIKSKDMTPSGSNVSIARLTRLGLPLNSTEIEMHLSLRQHINVKDIDVDSVNSLSIRSLVVSGTNEPQIITGRKIFKGELEINGQSKVAIINGIDVVELENNVLLKEGNQIIQGRHWVEGISARKSIITNTTLLGEQSFGNVITLNGDQIIPASTTIEGNINTKNAEIEELTVDGRVNNVNISEILNDVALKSHLPLKVLGEKSFKSLHIEHLNVVSLEEVLNKLDNEEVHLANTRKLCSLTADRIHFEKSFNGLEKCHFPIPVDEQIVVESVNELDSLKVLGKTYVTSNQLGDVTLGELVNDTIKMDEARDFTFASFENTRVENGVNLNGEVENLDLDNIWQNGILEPQIIRDKKTIRGRIIANGDTSVTNTVHGRNISEICRFTSNRDDKFLFVKGNVISAMIPSVLDLNGRDLTDMSKSLWFIDEPTTFNQSVNFGDATFKDLVIINGLLNDVDLDLLPTKYMSKTKIQSIPANITFTDDIIFEDDVAAPNLIISGTVNEMDIGDLTKNVLLNRDQLFEDIKYFGNISVSDVKGEFLLNGLSLATDILRFDKENKIVGMKRFKNLKIDNLHSERNVTIQGVNLDRFLKRVLPNEGISKVSGFKHIGDATFLKELGVAGKLNGGKFNKESIMTITTNQNIVGKKVFHPQNPEGIRFKPLKVKGLINDTDIMDLVKNQAIKTGDNVFESEVNFTHVISTKNVNFDKLYKGVNISQLVQNITELASLNYINDYYWNLLNRSEKIGESLKSQAIYLDYYKLILHHYKPIKILASTFNEREAVISYHCEDFKNIGTFLEWDDQTESFIQKEDFTLNLGPPLTYVSSVQYFGSDYIYMENEDADRLPDADYTHNGQLLHFENATQFHSTPLFTRGTSFLNSFVLEETQESCLLFIDYSYATHILCSQIYGQFYPRQNIEDEKVYMASFLNIDHCSYLITIGSPDREASNESRTVVWKMSDQLFNVYQLIYRGDPISVSSVSHNGQHFLAVAYIHFEHTMYFGMVEIFS
ncbi:unnamed protein product [Acanthoscelides obtectus]|nr:unnamed protein product [Acanthoscelides obtectus]CAK1650464.1 Thrombospondin-type laminin G domain and EAR repeat-containing protein [Acanthoscelides obtectus]